MSEGCADDFSVVLGVDEKTIEQLKYSLPTWWRHKPSLFERPFVVFYDRSSVMASQVKSIFQPILDYARVAVRANFRPSLTLVEWPPPNVVYKQISEDKWGNAQRAKMLSGFVHVPAEHVTTDYWLKLDTDVMADGMDDWVNPSWLLDGSSGGGVPMPTFCRPAIVAPAWNFTKPPDQMLKLDQWVTAFAADMPELASQQPLDIRPATPEADRVGHKRICSWCAFFSTEFTRLAAHYAKITCGEGRIPVPSQDGYCFYVAKRMGLPIIPVQMKNRGWRLVTHGRISQVHQELMNKED